MNNLWEQIGNKCLICAIHMLENEPTPTMATSEIVKLLVETAVSVDNLNLRWAQQTQSCAAVFRDQPVSLQATGNSTGIRSESE